MSSTHPPETTRACTADLVAWLDGALAPRLDERRGAWWAGALERVGAGLSCGQFSAAFSVASRHAPRVGLEPREADLATAQELLPGWNPARWDVLEAMRCRLLLARPDLDQDSFVRDLEQVSRHADEGELRAIYKSLALLPDAQRFTARGAEGCRTNIVPVFESVACDTPFPFEHFDDVAWNQMLIKGLFIEAPLVRVYGVDRRLNSELARMALDLADERRSAGRVVQPELWMCLGTFGGQRALDSMGRELEGDHQAGRRAAYLGLARSGNQPHAAPDPALAAVHQRVLAGDTGRTSFNYLDD